VGIYSVELYLQVRLACADGMSQRAAAKRFNVSRDTVRKMLSFSSPPGYRRQSVPQRPKLDGFVAIIDGWLEGGRGVPRKQRHTAKRVFDRLRTEHGFTGGYTIIKDYIRARAAAGRCSCRWRTAGDAQADFGEALVEIGGVEQKAYFFALDLPHSDACYVRAYPAAVAEAWVDGHVHAFAFFGAVPRSIVYDNDRCLVAKILPDGTRKRATLFSAFLSHYVIRDRYARPGKGNEKGNVEGLVGYCRRNFMVPIPKFPTWEGVQPVAGGAMPQRQQDKVRGQSETIGERLQRDLAAMQPLPATPFEACDQKGGRVSSQSLVRYRTNDYSVPVAWGHQEVWIRAYVDEVVIGCRSEVIARHPRCYAREEVVFARSIISR
jgi:transposase